MTKIYLIDHSLREIGGHHHQYACDVLQVAEQRGLEVVLATHRKFRPKTLPASWRLCACFPFDSYSKHALCVRGDAAEAYDLDGQPLRTGYSQNRPEDVPASKARRFSAWMEQRGRKKEIEGFVAGCKTLFGEVPIARGDQVFLTTATEFDLLGLASYLHDDAATLDAEWHMQFHFDLFEGREPEHERQTHKRAAIKRQIEHAMNHIPSHNISFYSTTKPLVDQYNSLGIGDFRLLNYPISRVFRPLERDDEKPLRVTCAGHLRREKGRSELSTLIGRIREQPLNRAIEFVIQRGNLRRIKQERTVDSDVDVRLTKFPHPLKPAEYEQLIRSSDVGLFLYHARRYYSRCSGILLEMLCSGVPVLVPGGCWLADQIHDSIQKHRANVSHSAARIGELSDFGPELPMPTAAKQFLVEVKCNVPPEPGTHATLMLDQFDGRQQLVSRTKSSLHLVAGETIRAMDHRHEAASFARVSVVPSFGDPPLPWMSTDAWCIQHPQGGTYPLAAVGLVAADMREAPRLLNEMFVHYEHYRNTAAEFAVHLQQRHDPERVIDVIVGAQGEEQIRRMAA